jgi:hypothetical protein
MDQLEINSWLRGQDLNLRSLGYEADSGVFLNSLS